MLYIVFYLRFFLKNIFNWSLYYAWTMSSEFDKESRINVKNDWRRSWKTITPALIFIEYACQVCSATNDGSSSLSFGGGEKTLHITLAVPLGRHP